MDIGISIIQEDNKEKAAINTGLLALYLMPSGNGIASTKLQIGTNQLN